MFDLYAIGKYPGNERRPGESSHVRAKRIEGEMRQGLPNDRFIPYVQVHEFEALILVDPSALFAQFPDGEAETAPDRLAASIGAVAPEMVNDGESTAPSKRIIAAVPQYARLKSVAGPGAVEEIGIDRLRTSCPHFHEWITRLEALSAEDVP